MANVEKMAAKLMELQAKRDELEEAIKNIRETIAEHVDLGENLKGDFKIVKTVTTRFDDALAKKTLPPKVYDSIAVPKADSKKAAALLTEEQLTACKKVFSESVRVTLRD